MAGEGEPRFAGFLADCPAFTGVDPATLDRLAADARDVELPSGAVLRQAGPFVPRRGALLIADTGGRSIDLVTPGEFCRPESGQTATAVEPAEVIVLPEEAVDVAWSASFEQLAVRPARSVDLETASVRTVMSPRLITIDAGDDCRVAAELMRGHRIASLVVTGRDEPGIVTDRDLANRLVATGRSPDRPVAEIATFPVRTIAAGTPIFEALNEMFATGIHHLPVVEEGRFVGMVTSTDLLALQGRSPLHLRKALDRADSVEALADAVSALPATVEALLAAGTSSADIGRSVATATDRVVRRLLEIAPAELGPAPADFAWLAFGSHGRLEQTLSADQDTGLCYPDDLDEEARAWFAGLGRWVTDALERCGYPRCPGGVMASEQGWRRSVSEWRNEFSSWIHAPDGGHLLGAEIGFDLRTVTGGLDADRLLGPTIATAADSQLFLGRLGREAALHRPPLGFRGRIAVNRSGPHAGTFDVKAGAMLPIVDLARLHRLARGGREVGTFARLEAAAADGSLSPDLAATLREGYGLALRLRLDRHLRCRRDGRPLDNRVDPRQLAPLVRSTLKETFRAIRSAQRLVESVYMTGNLA